MLALYVRRSLPPLLVGRPRALAVGRPDGVRRRAGGAPAARGSLARRDADTHARGDSISDSHLDAIAHADDRRDADSHSHADRDTFAHAVADHDALAHADGDRDALTPTPTATPTATPAPLITAEDLGIREVDTAEALAAAGLTHVRYAAGEEVPWDPGLFLLDTATGVVEGWVVSEGDWVDEEGTVVGTVSGRLSLSPGNRFLLFPDGALHDRMTGRTYLGARVVVQSSYPNDLVGWGSGSDERLLLSSGTAQAYAVVNGDMQAVAQLAGAGANLWPHPEGRYLFAHDRSQLQLFDLQEASTAVALTPSISWPLDWVTWTKKFDSAWVVPFDGGLAVIEAIDSSTCRIARYSADGQPPTDHQYPCWQDYGPFIDISPDGGFLAIARSGFQSFEGLLPQMTDISVFDVASGEELLRIRNAGQSSEDARFSDSWLADSSGIVVRTFRGLRLATLGGQWESASGLPAPEDHNVFRKGTSVRDRSGRTLAALRFGPPAREIRGGSDTWFGWGSTSNELRVYTGIFYEFANLGSFGRDAVIERPPFDSDDPLLVEVVVDTCLNLREEPSLEAPILTCLPNGAVAEVAEADDGWSSWMHLRTDDGLEGWASTEYLRWYSDGVRLEE